MIERALVLAFLVGCGDREVDVELHTPAQCGIGDGGVVASNEGCELGGLASIRIVVESSAGIAIAQRCEEAPSACRYEDLVGRQWLDDVPPQRAVAVRVQGFDGPDCAGEEIFYCESLGDHLVDLEDDGFPVDLFCPCPVP